MNRMSDFAQTFTVTLSFSSPCTQSLPMAGFAFPWSSITCDNLHIHVC